jgi:hypothetical protein
LTPSGHPDAAFVFAVATELGYEPSVSYLHSGRADYFRTKEDAFAEYEPMLAMSREDPQGSDRDEYLERLDTWLDEHLMTTERGGQTVLTPDIPRTNPWAFISWDT